MSRRAVPARVSTARPLACACACATVSALACLVAPSVARADSLRWTSVDVTPPCPTEATALVVDHETATVDCRATDGTAARCDAVVTYTVRNPTDTVVTSRLVTDVPRHDRVTATVDGVAVPDAAGFLVSVAAGGTAVLVLRRAQTRPMPGRDGRWEIPTDALTSLHPLLAREGAQRSAVAVEFQRAQSCSAGNGTAAWHGDGDVATVTVRGPSGWQPAEGDGQHGLCGEDASGLVCLLMEGTAWAPTVGLRMVPTLPLQEWRAGGPVLGLGGMTNGGFRMRMGYELGMGTRVIVGAMVDAATRGDVVLAATLGFPLVIPVRGWRRDWPVVVMPSVGAAVGALPTGRAGLRGQVTLGFFGVGVDVGVDYWPGDLAADVSVMLRVGL